MLPQLLCVLVAAAPPDGSVKLAAPGLTYVRLDDKVGDFFNDYFAQQVVLQGGVRVTTKTEISALLGFERQKELMGCSDKSTSCLAELAGALGVDGLITGSLAKLGSGYAINLKVVSATTGKPLAAYSTRVKGDDALLDWLGDTAKSLATTLKATVKPQAPVVENKPSLQPAPPPVAAAEPEPTVITERPSGGLRSKAWIPAAAGGAVLVAGVICNIAARGVASELRQPGTGTVTYAQFEKEMGRGRMLEGVGNAGIALGAAGLGAAVTFFLLGDGSPAGISAWGAPSAGGLTVSGALP